MKFTEEQQLAIDLRKRNILVSAAAGSGKTAVLTERIVNMVSNESDPVDVDRLLVVTFTNAAASEMRERIARAIEARLETCGENEHLQRQSALLHNAQITTIDSFCLYLIRNHFNDIGLDPGFRVADEGEIRLMMQEVLQETLEAGFAQKDPDFLYCVDYFSSGNSDRGIEEGIRKLYQFAESNPWPEEWLEARKKDYEITCIEQLNEAVWMKEALKQVRGMADYWVQRMEECLRICEQPDGPYMYGELLENEAEKLKALKDVKEYEAGHTGISSISFGRLPTKKDDSVSKEKRELVQAIRNEVKEEVKKTAEAYFAFSPEKLAEQMQESSRAVCTLVDLVLEFRKALSQRKREENLLDFNDMEHLALSILLNKTEQGGEEPTKAALDYREHFQEILIDEYQDSNLVQEKILQSIARKQADGHNCFMVGDVKQSIYKFRLARPELFLEKYDTYFSSLEPEAGTIGCRIDLHKNFRSRSEVVEGINYMFHRIMQKQLGGIAYDEKAMLYPAAVYPELPDPSISQTELLLITKGTESSGSQESPKENPAGKAESAEKTDKEAVSSEKISKEAAFSGTTGKDGVVSGSAGQENGTGILTGDSEEGEGPSNVRQKEARAVAGRIRELVGSYPVTDAKTGMLRPASYKDIVILLRATTGWAEDFKEVLKKYGIPAHITSKTGYFAAAEVQVLLQLLQVLDNPIQDIPLYGVMKSFFGGFTDHEAAWIRGVAGKKKKSLYMSLQDFAGTECLEPSEKSTGEGLSGEGLSREELPREELPREGLSGEELSGERLPMEGGEVPWEALYPFQEGTGARPESARELSREDRKTLIALQEKVRRFLEFLEDLRERSVCLSIHELLRHILNSSGYLNYVSALPAGEQRRANVQMLLEKAVGFEKTSYYGLFHFNRYMEQLKKYEVDYGEANILDEHADVVRIMSIHKSKGLEFPICFVSGLTKRFNMTDLGGRMIVDVDMGIGVEYVDPVRRIRSGGVSKHVLSEKIRLDNLAEELRVLYVALTRAKEKLIMTGMLDKSEKRIRLIEAASLREEKLPGYGELAGASSYLDLILHALVHNPAFDVILDHYGLSGSVKREEEKALEIRILGEQDLLKEDVKDSLYRERARAELIQGISGEERDPDFRDQLEQIFSYRYAHQNLEQLYTKTTVSELKKAGNEMEDSMADSLYTEEVYEQEEEGITPYLPRFMREDTVLAGAERGNAFHKVMELLDLRREAGTAAQQMEELEQSGRLSREFWKAIDPRKIDAFLQSSLAERMKTADQNGLLWREQPFVQGVPANRLKEEFPEEELILIQGIIDVYFEEDGELVVADYKTDRVNSPEELIERYQVQLGYYADALKQMTGKEVKEKVIYSFCLKQEIHLP